MFCLYVLFICLLHVFVVFSFYHFVPVDTSKFEKFENLFATEGPPRCSPKPLPRKNIPPAWMDSSGISHTRYLEYLDGGGVCRYRASTINILHLFVVIYYNEMPFEKLTFPKCSLLTRHKCNCINS